ncbi:MAG: creatininase family protein [Armatimonadota bacterium]|nr:creatininase family protein [Armatimonadota bacterium]
MSYLFRDQSSTTLREHIEQQSLLLLPVGTTEEHGPHLPVDTDVRIAEAYGHALAREIAGELPVLLMDAIRYGYSMSIMRQWPGTIVVGTRTFMDYVFGVCRSVLEMGFRHLAVLDCHGHHSGLLSGVNRELCDACDVAIAIISPARLSAEAFNEVRRSDRGGAIHGGEWETSLLLHISPEVVDMSLAGDEDAMRYHSEFVAGDNFTGGQKVTWSTWYLQPSHTGIYGDPTVATAQTGEAIMRAAVETGARFLREFYHHAPA